MLTCERVYNVRTSCVAHTHTNMHFFVSHGVNKGWQHVLYLRYLLQHGVYQHIHVLGSFNMVANREIQLSDFLRNMTVIDNMSDCNMN